MQIVYRIQDDSWVEDVVGVEQLLELPHELVGGGTPLHLHVRRHVAPSAVLTLHTRQAFASDENNSRDGHHISQTMLVVALRSDVRSQAAPRAEEALAEGLLAKVADLEGAAVLGGDDVAHLVHHV